MSLRVVSWFLRHQMWHYSLPNDHNILHMFARHPMWHHYLAVGFQGRILFMAVLWVCRVESCVWLSFGFSGSNPVNGTKYNTMVCTVGALFLNIVPNIVLWLSPAPIITLSHRPVPNGIQRWSYIILVTAAKTFPDCLFINLLYAYAVFERSTDRE